MNKLHLIIFFAVVVSVYFGMNYYLYSHVVRGFSLGANVRPQVRFLFLILALLFVAGELLSRKYTSPLSNTLTYAGAVWLGILSMSIVIFLFVDIARIFFRSDGFRLYAAISAMVILGILTAYSIVNVLRGPVINEFCIKINGLDPKYSGFSIVQISDIHMTTAKSAKWLDRLVTDVNSLKPGLIVITGDLIDADLCNVNGFCDILKNLSAQHGVYAVTGNHEYYSGIDRFEKICERSNIRLLRNSVVNIGNVFNLAGIDDAEFGNPKEALDKLLAHEHGNLEADGKSLILLYHRPDIFDYARERGVDLMLCGHTHAGQIPPMDFLVYMVYKYPWGLYKAGLSYVYTSAGTGYWGPPMRLTSRAEITKIQMTN